MFIWTQTDERFKTEYDEFLYYTYSYDPLRLNKPGEPLPDQAELDRQFKLYQDDNPARRKRS